MRANRAFRLIVTREDSRPAFLADPESLERVEVVSIEDNEPFLYWNMPVRDSGPLVRALRADLAGMDREQFIGAWEGADRAG
jgi:hypothetical protein